MLRSIAWAAALVVAGPATALTCLELSVGNSFEVAEERPEQFVMALGALRHIGEAPPQRDEKGDQNMRESYSFDAAFEGRFATNAGFTAERSVPVTVEVRCVSAWCGGNSLSEYGLYFLRRDAPGAYALEAGPCPIYFFENPTEGQLTDAINLLR